MIAKSPVPPTLLSTKQTFVRPQPSSATEPPRWLCRSLSFSPLLFLSRDTAVLSGAATEAAAMVVNKFPAAVNEPTSNRRRRVAINIKGNNEDIWETLVTYILTILMTRFGVPPTKYLLLL